MIRTFNLQENRNGQELPLEQWRRALRAEQNQASRVEIKGPVMAVGRFSGLTVSLPSPSSFSFSEASLSSVRSSVFGNAYSKFPIQRLHGGSSSPFAFVNWLLNEYELYNEPGIATGPDGVVLTFTPPDGDLSAFPAGYLFKDGERVTFQVSFDRSSRKRPFDISVLLEGTPFTLYLFGMEVVGSEYRLRPFTFDELPQVHTPLGAAQPVSNPSYDPLPRSGWVHMRPISLAAEPLVGAMAQFAKRLRPVPTDRLLRDAIECGAQHLPPGGGSILTDVAKAIT